MDLSRVMSGSGENDKFVTLVASLEGSEPVRRRVRKDVIQSESSFLKEYIQDGATEIEIPLKRPQNLNSILEYINEGQFTVLNGNHLESLWNDARILGLMNLEGVCIERLTDTISLDSWTCRLEFSQAQGLHELESKVLSFVNDNFAKCCSSSTFTSLNLDQMIQVLKLSHAKTTVTEAKRIVLILNWIKANENGRCLQAHRLLEKVDLMSFNEKSLRFIINKEAALRNWRSVAIFERAIRLKKIQATENHSNAIKGQTSDVQGQPDAVQRQFDALQGQSYAVKRQPGVVQGQPGVVQGQLDALPGQPDAVKRQHDTLKRQQNVVPGPPGTVQCQPDAVQGKQKVVQGQPNDSELFQAGRIISLDNRLVINMKPNGATSEESSDAQLNVPNETTYPEDSVKGCRFSMMHKVTPPLPSSVCETTETVRNNADDAPPPKMPRLECSQMKIAPVTPIQWIRSGFIFKQKQILYFSQVGSGARSLKFVIVSAGGAISAPQNLLSSLPNYVHGIPKLIWNQEARNLCFLGNFDGNGSILPTFKYMNAQGAPKVSVLPQTLHQRHHHQPVLLNGCLYVFGGSQSVIHKNNDRLNTSEALNMTAAEWQWKLIASTATKRNYYAAACVKGNIYVTGGVIDRPTKDSSLITDHALCYQPRGNRWNQLNFMKGSRCRHALAVLGHKIYVFGGGWESCKDLANMKSAEVYDVHTNMWTLIAPMLRPRYEGCAVEIDGKIYVIGGDQSQEGESRSSVECYDPVSNSWTLISESVDDQGLFNSIAVIDDPECFLKGC